MGDSTFVIFVSIFRFVVAVISLFVFLVNVCLARLPSNRIKELEYLMDDTEALFKKALGDEYLVEFGSIWQIEHRLTILKKTTHRLQCRAYTTITICDDCREFFIGTSGAIGDACHSVKELRANLIVAMAKARQLVERGLATGRSSSMRPNPRESFADQDSAICEVDSRKNNHSMTQRKVTWTYE